MVDHTEIDEHLEEIAEKIIVEHLFYTISIATNNRIPGIFFHCVNRDIRVWHQSPGSRVSIGSGNGLVPSGTKPFPEPVLTHQWGLVVFKYLRAISQWMFQISILHMNFKITTTRLQPRGPGANEVKGSRAPLVMSLNIMVDNRNPHRNHSISTWNKANGF